MNKYYVTYSYFPNDADVEYKTLKVVSSYEKRQTVFNLQHEYKELNGFQVVNIQEEKEIDTIKL